MKMHSRQRGAAALAVSMFLLFGMTLVAFFANRAQIFEQRTSANQYRSTRAFEMAEAGLEWATARLNEDIVIGNSPSCTSGAGTQTFRDRFLAPVTGSNPSFTPDTVARVGCSFDDSGTPTCSCPTGATAPTYGAATEPRFTVQFNSVAGDPLAVEIISYGCTNAAGACNAASSSDAKAVVSTMLKVRPKYPNAPGAGLVTGSAAVTGGNLNVINLDLASNGVTINSGTTVELGTGTSVTTLAGTPPRASVLDNDASLNSLTTADSDGNLFFQSMFGESIAAYKANPQTWLITSGSCGTRTRCTSCGSASSCGSAVSAAYNLKATQFWLDTDASFTNANLPTVGTLGTASLPVSIAGSGNVELRSNMTAYGLIYAATATATDNWDYSGSGSAKIFGSLVSRGDFNKGSGTLDVIYDPNIFGAGKITGLLIRVPGSWRDKSTPYAP